MAPRQNATNPRRRRFIPGNPADLNSRQPISGRPTPVDGTEPLEE